MEQVITLFFNFMMTAMVVATITKFVCDGIITAWAIDNVWLKRATVLLMNMLLTYYSCQVLNSFTYIETFIVLLFAIAGADALHSAMNKIKEFKFVENTQMSIPDNTEYSEEE